MKACTRLKSRAFGRTNESHSAPAGLEMLEQRCLMSISLVHGTWTIRGDSHRHELNDQITVRLDPSDPRYVQASVNGGEGGAAPICDIKRIRIIGGRGNDTIDVDLGSAAGGIETRIYGGDGDDRITGGAEGDIIFGGSGADVIFGGGGDDIIFGGRGDDTLNGGEGDDIIFGGRGNDLLDGGEGSDSLLGSRGDDILRGWSDDRVLNSGRGVNVVYGQGLVNKVGRRDMLLDQADTSLSFSDAMSSAIRQKLIDDAVAWWKDVLGTTESWRSLGLPTHTHYGDFDGHEFIKASSDVNNQVSGVDESDFVKTDGEFIYMIKGLKLLIVKAAPADDMRIVSQTHLSDQPLAMYLHDNLLTIVSQKHGWGVTPMYDTVGGPVFGTMSTASLAGRTHVELPVDPIDSYMFMPRSPWPWLTSLPQLTVQILDVSDAAAPVTLESTTVDGTLSDSRAIDGRVYLVVKNLVMAPPPAGTWNDDTGAFSCEDEASYRARLEEFFQDDLMGYSTSVGTEATGAGSLLDTGHVYVPEGDDTYAVAMSVVLFNVEDGHAGVDTASSVFDVDGLVYASQDNLYLVTSDFNRWLDSGHGGVNDIYKFSLGTDSIPLAASGQIPGRVLNRYSMDESGGYLRVAATNFSDELSNSVYVLEQNGDKLDIVGSVLDLGLGESIQSVRFMGDRGYVCTFSRMDPLFSLDLSNPFSPTLMGELEVPGFSSYLHPMGDNYLIGIGHDADTVTGRTEGLQLSLFDVSDLSHPKLSAIYSLGDDAWTSYSQAEWDAHAFSFFDEQDILALPVSSYDQESGEDLYQLDVFGVTPDGGFELLGQIDHDSFVTRSLRIGNVLYSFSDTNLKANLLDQPHTQLGSIDLPSSTREPFLLNL